jgi:hypothetical protein
MYVTHDLIDSHFIISFQVMLLLNLPDNNRQREKYWSHFFGNVFPCLCSSSLLDPIFLEIWSQIISGLKSYWQLNEILPTWCATLILSENYCALDLCSCLRVTGHVSEPYKNTDIIIAKPDLVILLLLSSAWLEALWQSMSISEVHLSYLYVIISW